MLCYENPTYKLYKTRCEGEIRDTELKEKVDIFRNEFPDHVIKREMEFVAKFGAQEIEEEPEQENVLEHNIKENKYNIYR